MVIKKVADFNPKSGLFQRIRIPPPNERLVDYCFASSSFLSFSSSSFSSSFCLNFCYFLFINCFSSLFFSSPPSFSYLSSFVIFFFYLSYCFFLFLTSTLRGVDAIAMYVITVRKQYITISPTVQLWNDYLPSDSVLTRRNVDFFLFVTLVLPIHYDLDVLFFTDRSLFIIYLFYVITYVILYVHSVFSDRYLVSIYTLFILFYGITPHTLFHSVKLIW